MACPVCHVSLKESPEEPRSKRAKLDIQEVQICVTPCGHMFHRACLIHSFLQEGKCHQLRSKVTGGSCPICQKHTTERQLYPAYNYNDNASSSTSASCSVTSILSATEVPKEPTPACAEQSPEVTSTLADQQELMELQRLYEQLRNDYEELKTTSAQETQRADFNEGLVKSLQNDLQNLKQQVDRKDAELLKQTDNNADAEDNNGQ